MKLNRENMILYAITDRRWLNGKTLAYKVEEAIKGGVTIIQLREKHISNEEFVKEAMEIKAVTDKYNVPLIINDNIDVALAVDATGVHIGQSDEELLSARAKLGREKIIGVSAHNVDEAVKAVKDGADYLGVGDLFGTATKKDTVKVTYETIKEICNCVSVPVVGIGGISKDNINKLKGSGVSGVAVISAVFACDDVKEASKELRLLSEALGK